MRPCVHFVGFRDDRYWNAAVVFGKPDFIHKAWDRRSQREIGEGDLIVFASGRRCVPRISDALRLMARLLRKADHQARIALCQIASA